MKVLEDRTFASKRELEDVEMVEDLMDKRRNPTQTDSRNVVDRREVSEVTLAKRLITDRLKRDEDEIAEMLGKQVEVLTDKKLDDDEDDHEILKPSFKFRIGGCKESMLSKKLNGVKKINISLDSLDREKFKHITRRDQFDIVYKNMFLLIEEGFNVKVNVVLMKDFNDNEIIDFINLTKDLPISVRFIEFMPFDGNKWNMSKMVSYAEVMNYVNGSFSNENIERLQDAPNDTSKNYKISGYNGSFAIISSVTNPFCDSCNRLRLTANGQLKNCLFSSSESDLLTTLRAGKSIEPIIKKAVEAKFKVRGGMDTLEKLQEPKLHNNNRSMITIGG